MEAVYSVQGDVRTAKYDADTGAFIMDNGASVLVGRGTDAAVAGYVYTSTGINQFNRQEACIRFPLDGNCAVPYWKWLAVHAAQCAVTRSDRGEFLVVLPPCSLGGEGTEVIRPTASLAANGDLLSVGYLDAAGAARSTPFVATELDDGGFAMAATFSGNPAIKLVSVKVTPPLPPSVTTLQAAKAVASQRQTELLSRRIEIDRATPANAPTLLNGTLVRDGHANGRSPLVWTGAIVLAIAMSVILWKRIKS